MGDEEFNKQFHIFRNGIMIKRELLEANKELFDYFLAKEYEDEKIKNMAIKIIPIIS